MSGEKKLWRLPTPFRGSSGKQAARSKDKAGRSGSRVSSVYLSDGSSTNGFIVESEFDDPGRTQTIHGESHPSELSATTHSNSSSTNGVVDNYPCDHHGSYAAQGSHDDSDDDLAQRLGSAYEHIRAMPFGTQHGVLLSSDPQMLRKQLGVPQHSVLNYPIHSSPDLPNPHAASRDPASPRPSSSTAPDISHSREPNSCTPRYNHFSDPFQPTPLKPAISGSILTEKSSLRCKTFETPRVHCTANYMPSIRNTSKVAKRHGKKSIALSSSRRRALGGVLRKYADTPPSSSNAHRRKISLPRIRPPSPFRVDIPLHHTWHERRADFKSSSECHSRTAEYRDNKPRRTSSNTEVLASLAWIGTSRTAPDPCFANQKRRTTCPAFSSDRFSMTIAVEDDNITDVDLVDQLEKWNSGRKRAPRYVFANNQNLSETFKQLAKPREVSLPSLETSTDATSDPEDTAVWQAAKKALLCVREIVRTEKKYQEALRMLLDAQTATPPPPSMAAYVSALIHASKVLLKGFLEDPSAWGVSTAFVTSEDEIETTMVSWCAVAGEFFADENDPRPGGLTGRWRLRKTGVMSSPSSSVTERTCSSPSPQLPPVFSTTTNARKKTKERMDGEYHTRHYPRTEQEGHVTFLQNLEGTNGRSGISQAPSRKPSVRDLAIQPTQRVMRYVLLYRDLMDCTPLTSPSRLLVERALEAAMRIASHCDEAQRNPAFYRAS